MIKHAARRLLSAILSSAIAAGVMVVIVEEGPTEMPYYGGSWERPISSPNLYAPELTENTYMPQGTANGYQDEASDDAQNGYTEYSSRAE